MFELIDNTRILKLFVIVVLMQVVMLWQIFTWKKYTFLFFSYAFRELEKEAIYVATKRSNYLYRIIK